MEWQRAKGGGAGGRDEVEREGAELEDSRGHHLPAPRQQCGASVASVGRDGAVQTAAGEQLSLTVRTSP